MKTKVLHVAFSATMGGIESFILNLVKTIDLERFQVDVVAESETISCEDELVSYGCQVIKCSKQTHLFSYFFDLFKIFKHRKYDVVHFHKNSAANISGIIAAKMAGVNNIIVHSHNTRPNGGVVFTALHYLNRWAIPICANQLLACSEIAANWMYGANQSTVRIVHNGIIVDNFIFNAERRESFRSSLGIGDKLALGAVARFEKQKNICFMIDILAELINENINAVLILVGSGSMKDEIKQYAKNKCIEQNVIFLGVRKNIPDIMFGLDIYLMPSLYEGLPFSGVEAQAAGLPILCSDTISKEINFTGNVLFTSLTAATSTWAQKVLELNMGKRIDTHRIIIEKGFDIRSTACLIEDLYSEMKGDVDFGC